MYPVCIRYELLLVVNKRRDKILKKNKEDTIAKLHVNCPFFFSFFYLFIFPSFFSLARSLSSSSVPADASAFQCFFFLFLLIRSRPLLYLSAGHRPKHRTPTLLPSASITHANAAPPQASSAPVAGYLRPCAHRRLPLLRCICKKSVLVA
jgi:hypothetical protein